MAKIKFITDSAADIPQNHVEALGITVLPFPIILEDREIHDAVDYTRTEFLHLLDGLDKIPTHAQLTPFQFEECFTQAQAEGFDAAIYVSINSKGSNTYNNAVQARAAYLAEHPDFDIRIIDSRSYTYNIGYPVVEAAKRAAEGGLTVDEAEALIRDWLDHAVILFAPYDLRFARKSGRVPVAAAVVGTALGIRPIMSFPDGDSKVLAKPRGDKNVVSTMVKMAQEDMEPDSPYLIIHAISPEHNRELSEACRAAFGYDPAEEFVIGGVVAVNAGPNLVGIIYRSKTN